MEALIRCFCIPARTNLKFVIFPFPSVMPLPLF
jgi:hypothetical protein